MRRHLKAAAALIMLIAFGAGFWALAAFAPTAFLLIIGAVGVGAVLGLIYFTLYELMS